MRSDVTSVRTIGLKLLPVISVFLACATSWAANPATGNLTDQSPTVTYTGGPYYASNPGAQAGNPVCTAPSSCDIFTLNVTVAAAYQQTKQINISVGWPNTTADFDLYVFDANGVLIGSDANSADPEVVNIPAVSGTYTVEAVPFLPLGQTFAGSISLQPIPTAPQQGKGVPARYQIFQAPTSAGGANQSGEPSIGVDWNPNSAALKHDKVNQGGVVFFTSNLNEFRVSFDDCASPANATWQDVSSPIETVNTLDPIGFCDHYGAQPSPGRVFQSQLAGATSLMAFSDNDGATWTQSQGSGQPAGIDHQTVGGGPYNPNATPPPVHPFYPNAIYYCSQDDVTAFCSRSDDGGLTFGPGVPIYNLTQCGGIHGHVKVAPNGTVYVPNATCGAYQGAAVSTDNGITWTVRTIPDSTPGLGLVDPSIGLASDSTAYFGYQDNSGHPKIAVSHDNGQSWSNSYDVGGAYNLQNMTFPEVVAGDPDRAAFMFLGTPTGGNYQDAANFMGIWHLYVATTYDGGASYITVDATPDQPVQVGSICDMGTTACASNAAGGADRNMLDFMDATMDSQGRLLGAFAAGCVAGSCDATSSPSASRSALGSIVRQSGGRRLLAAFDPKEPAKPAAPQVVSANSFSNGTVVTWNAPDNGGQPITKYKILRGTAPGTETALATIPPTKTAYLDKAAKTGTQYYYKVAAINKLGVGPTCGELTETPGPAAPSPCKLPGVTVATDPAGDQTGAPANGQLDIQSISIAEPATGGIAQLFFTMKVANLATPVQPNSGWTIFFTTPDNVEHYVDMNTESGTTPVFEYGHVSVLATGGKSLNKDGSADPASTYTADGTITIVIDNANVGSPKAGDQLVSVYGNTQTLIGGGGTGLLANIDTTANGAYILIGNQACNSQAVLTANVTTGTAPLTISFQGNKSVPSPGATITSYTFNFGDGSAPVTQVKSGIAHRYKKAGTYNATLTLTDSNGDTSAPATLAITLY